MILTFQGRSSLHQTDWLVDHCCPCSSGVKLIMCYNYNWKRTWTTGYNKTNGAHRCHFIIPPIGTAPYWEDFTLWITYRYDNVLASPRIVVTEQVGRYAHSAVTGITFSTRCRFSIFERPEHQFLRCCILNFKQVYVAFIIVWYFSLSVV